MSLKQKPGEPTPKPERMVTAKKPSSKHFTAPAAGAAKPVVPAKRPPSTVARRDQQPSGLHQTTPAPPGTRHPAGLAIDVGLLHKKEGRWLSVARQFQGHIGDKTCGDGARVPEAPDAKELRALVCEASDLGSSPTCSRRTTTRRTRTISTWRSSPGCAGFSITEAAARLSPRIAVENANLDCASPPRQVSYLLPPCPPSPPSPPAPLCPTLVLLLLPNPPLLGPTP